MEATRSWVALLAPLVVVSALVVVCVKYDARVKFHDLQKETSSQDKLENEWARLQLEYNTWSTNSRIEKVARENLNLVTPKADEIIFINIK
ncbi:MAG: cell division protein FtsL [Cycloclasticus sp. symbiont of Poecilosclerida sp. M]|nr:MAG: cell division protein FtsL [Cycloclasticus sp. symbiont of Poecilosclerida sp. M]